MPVRVRREVQKEVNMEQESYVKAIKKADRELELEDSPGFKARTRIHKSKKKYSRKHYKIEGE